MIDAHCHIADSSGESILCPLDWMEGNCDFAWNAKAVFFGYHPWQTESFDKERLCCALEENPLAGVGEIGLDRLREKTISPRSREVFSSQLEIAALFKRPVVLHGAKCWGEVAKEARRFAPAIPAFLFHGFSRSSGLIGDIKAMNGFISIGPALLNDHAVNYRELAAKIPLDMLLVESDRTSETPADAPKVADIALMLAKLRRMHEDQLIPILDSNAERFLAASSK